MLEPLQVSWHAQLRRRINQPILTEDTLESLKASLHLHWRWQFAVEHNLCAPGHHAANGASL